MHHTLDLLRIHLVFFEFCFSEEFSSVIKEGNQGDVKDDELECSESTSESGKSKDWVPEAWPCSDCAEVSKNYCMMVLERNNSIHLS